MARMKLSGETAKIIKGKRDHALKFVTRPTAQRAGITAPTSMAVKVVDPELRRMIDAAVAARQS